MWERNPIPYHSFTNGHNSLSLLFHFRWVSNKNKKSVVMERPLVAMLEIHQSP